MYLEEEHIDQDVLEEYALGHLSEAEEEAVEEHLLLCHECQDKLNDIDEFIRAVRVASPALNEAPSRPPGFWDKIGTLASPWTGWKPVYAAGALAAVLAIIVLAPGQGRLEGPAVEVSLESMRGDGAAIAEAIAGRPIALKIDLAGLEGVSRFAVEIADVAGVPVWRGEAEGAGGSSIRLEPDVSVRAGDYWVRAYDASSPGKLLREYALRVRPGE